MIASDKVLAKLDFGVIREKLMSICMLPGAKELAETLVPVADMDSVKALLRETDEGKALLRLNPLFTVRGSREIRPYLERCDRGGMLNPEELLEIRDTLKTARRLRMTLMESSGSGKDSYNDLYSLKEIVQSILPQKDIEEDITRSVSEDGSIADRASEELARLRKTKGVSQQRIKESMDGILRNPAYQKMLQDNVITTRGDRYVVPIKLEYSSAFPGIVHDQSASGATVYIEPMSVVKLGNELREIQLKENREIQRILQQLTAKVAVRVADIANLYGALIKLDFILAKARLSEDMEAGSPILVNKQEVKLVKARHPLLTGAVVPISLELGLKYQFLIITGPNTGGKTVTLKTVGLMAVMLQSGLHIPVESDSRMGIFTRLYVDIGDEQSVEQSLSTFSAHMTNIVAITQEADDRSLVLLDELGAGTDPAEGAALAMAILSDLLERGCCGVATTHYGSLKAFAYNTPGAENASVEFDLETLKPTYRLLTGIPGRSNALLIARRLGLDHKILDKAREYISERDTKENDLLENLEDTQREIELKKRRVEEEQLKAERKATELKKKNLELEEKYEEILNRAKEEAVEIIRQTRLEADSIIKDIKEAQKKERREQQAALEQSRSSLKELSGKVYEGRTTGNRKSSLKPEQIEPGQAVYIPNLRQKGQILKRPDNNNEVLIQTGIMKVSVPLAEIRLVDETRKPEHFEKTLKGTLGLNKALNLRSEIDLRGNLVEEALILLDKYMDDAVITGINQISIIHGKGTGALRAGIHQFLKRHPHVASYRLGEFGEGDSGVTIVALK
ncbi:endonuclease MutS2 [Dehalobacter sp. DCM]|uniref:endonuclease MutS2 n=1 Tax=Dehalobacter sp. DCM TaxID=2907827 RepID=UPI003081BEC2|nr:endonuclease MutS2 [Dehalobacter sp. DCM]